MRKIGEYKGGGVYIASLFIRLTYSDYLACRQDDPALNREIVHKTVKKLVRDKFDSSLPHVVAGLKEIDYKKHLPFETVIAELHGSGPKEKSNYGLIMVWFQYTNQDPFVVASEKFKTIDWENEAMDLGEE